MKVYRHEDNGSDKAVHVDDGDVFSFPAGQEVAWPVVCCGCGLAHVYTISAVEDRVLISVEQDQELTAKGLHLSRYRGEAGGPMAMEKAEALARDRREEKPEKNPAAVALGRLGGKKGGRARAKALSPERRREIAKKAAEVRWGKERAAT